MKQGEQEWPPSFSLSLSSCSFTRGINEYGIDLYPTGRSIHLPCRDRERNIGEQRVSRHMMVKHGGLHDRGKRKEGMQDRMY